MIGNGVVVDPPRFLEEVGATSARAASPSATTSSSAIMPTSSSPITWRKNASAKARSDNAHRHHRPRHRSVLPGQGRPAVSPSRVGELLHPGHLRERLGPSSRKNRLAALPRRHARSSTSTRSVANTSACEQMRPHIADTIAPAARGTTQGQRHPLRGGPGQLCSTSITAPIPFVTSSNSSTAGVWSGSGVPARRLDRWSASSRPTPRALAAGRSRRSWTTAQTASANAFARPAANTAPVTGRPRPLRLVRRRRHALHGHPERRRRTGRHAAGRAQRVSTSCRIAVAYEIDGQRLDDFPADAFLLERCRPVYETLPGWRQDVSGGRRLADLPAAARRYVDRLAELLGLPVSIVSVGPDRTQTIIASDLLLAACGLARRSQRSPKPLAARG